MLEAANDPLTIIIIGMSKRKEEHLDDFTTFIGIDVSREKFDVYILERSRSL